MYKNNNWISWMSEMIKDFFVEVVDKPQCEILELYDCEVTGHKKAVIKLSGRHIIEKNISEIITDNNLIDSFDKKTIRLLTYMATVEIMKPDYSVVVQHLGEEVDDYILEIKSKNGKDILKKSPSELVNDLSLISKFSPQDANRIGYLAGIKETVKEFNLKANLKELDNLHAK